MAELTDGTVVAQIYRVQEHLGGGGFGETYLAENTTLPGNQVVVKTVASPDQGLEEAQTLVSLQSANVVRVLAFDQTHRAIVMERAAGEPLANRIGRIDMLTAIRIAREVAMALSDLEASQLVHRDVKPENVMVELRGVGGRLIVKLIDFGIALKVGKPLTTDPVGSPLYCPAEQHDRHMPPHPTDDVYALGGVLFHMLAHRPPFEPPVLEETDRLSLLRSVGLPTNSSLAIVEALQLRSMHTSAPVPSLFAFLPVNGRGEREKHLIERLDELLTRMLAKSRQERPRAREVEAELDSLASTFSEAATSAGVRIADLMATARKPTATLVLPARPKAAAPAAALTTGQLVAQVNAPSRNRLMVGGLLALLLGVGVVVAFWPSPPPPPVKPPPVEPLAVVVPPPLPVVAPVAVEPLLEDAGPPEELAPLAKNPTRPVVKPSPADDCVVDARWRKAIETDLLNLRTAVASKLDANGFGAYTADEDAVLAKAEVARTSVECAAVNKRVDALMKKYAP
ncbi:MAG: serine/threonine protein kinase [Myxococcus sp.]|nr:serine/threonine protein kinase [Myxococcus sp.]